MKENLILKLWLLIYGGSSLHYFSAQNVQIKDSSGFNIELSDLNVGDRIKILYKEKEDKIALAYEVEPIYNVESIELLSKGLPNHIAKYIYNSTDKLLISVSEFTEEKLSLKIKDFNPDPFTLTNSYVLLSGDEYNKNIKEVDILTKDNVRILNRLDDNTIEEQFDLTKIFGKLKSEKYRFIQFLDEPYAIRIDFEIKENGDLIYESPIIEKFHIPNDR